MKRDLGLLSIYIHLDPASCSTVNTIRTRFPKRRNALEGFGMIHGFMPSETNQELLHHTLSQMASNQPPFPIKLTTFFRSRGQKPTRKAVGLNIESSALVNLRSEMRAKLQDAEVLGGVWRHIPGRRHPRVVSLRDECAVAAEEAGRVWRPKITLSIGVSDEKAESDFKLLQGLYGGKDMGHVMADGFSVGRARILKTLPREEELPVTLFPFQGKN